MLRCKTETRPGLVALYDIRPGNGAGPFLQPRSPHRALKVRTSKVEVTRLINAVIKNSHFLGMGRCTNFKLGTRMELWPVVTSNVKGRGHNVTSLVWDTLTHYLTKKGHASTKTGMKVVCAMGEIAHQLQGQRSGSPEYFLFVCITEGLRVSSTTWNWENHS